MVSVVVPSRGRPAYLEAALASVVGQAATAGGEVIVVDDGPSSQTGAVARRHGTRYLGERGGVGLNAARNAGVAAAQTELVVFVDDDVVAQPGWLAALLATAAAHPEWDMIGGPIAPRLEGSSSRGCGREGPPVTSLDLGADDGEARSAWGANMLIRRAAFTLAGPFDEARPIYGDEEEWEQRLVARGGRIGYAAGARVLHRRAGPDARPAALTRAAWARGRAARRWDVAREAAPAPAAEATVLARCLGHTARRRCAWGAYAAAHAAGRLCEALAA